MIEQRNKQVSLQFKEIMNIRNRHQVELSKVVSDVSTFMANPVL